MAENTKVLPAKYHVIADIDIPAGYHSDEEIAADKRLGPLARKNRYSVTCMTYHPGRDSIFCGCTNTSGNILHEFSRKKGTFKSTGYQKVNEPNEVKIHKGLWLDEEQNALYFGTATLSPIPTLIHSPGGKLVKLDIDSGKFTNLGIPGKGCYIQATNYDKKRRLMYSFSIWDLGFSVWSLKKKSLVRSHPMGSIVHIAAMDDDGGIWGTYGIDKHAFFRYDPDKDEFAAPATCRIANSLKASNIMYIGAGPVDCMINGGDGFIYAASALCELYRIDPKTFAVEYLGRPFPYNRMPGLVVAEDGMMYGVGGDDHATSLFRYDREARSFEILGLLKAADGKTCFRPHDLVVVGRTAYVGETDNPRRSGYLWECNF